MPEPDLHLGDVRFVLQGVGGGRRPQGMGAEAGHRRQSDRAGIVPDDIPVDGRWVQRLGEGLGGVVLHRPEQRPVHLLGMPGRLQVGVDQPQGGDGGSI